MKNHLSKLIFGCAVFVLFSCSDEDTAGSEVTDQSCVPGASIGCACTDGSAGGQVCLDDGSSFGDCQCNVADNNGPGNNGPGNNGPGNNGPGNNGPGNNEPGNNEPGNNEPGNNEPGPVDCPSEVFLDVTQFEGAGQAYPDPSVTVTCDGDEVVVLSNGIPHYAFIRVTPNELQAQNNRYTFPRYPVLVEEMETIPLLGVVGVAINGVPFYGPNEAERPDPFGDPVYNDILDWCLGHTAGRGDYHYHALLEACLTGAFIDDEEPDPQTPSPILGYALDGFPIYGPRGCADEGCDEIVTFESSWVQTGDPTTYAWDNHACDSASCEEAQGNKLDRCNGRVGPDGRYRYHATETFPYILGCYHGSLDGGGDGPDPNPDPEPGMMNPEDQCQVDDDCADCGADLGCVCRETPMGWNRCAPLCETDADCPNPQAQLCGRQGLCVPRRD